MNSVLTSLYLVAEQYSGPLEEYTALTGDIHSQIDAIEDHPDRRRDYFLWIIRKKYRNILKKRYAERGKKKALEGVVIKLEET